MATREPDGRLPDFERLRIYEQDIRPYLFDRAPPREYPVLVLIGGQPGSG